MLDGVTAHAPPEILRRPTHATKKSPARLRRAEMPLAIPLSRRAVLQPAGRTPRTPKQPPVGRMGPKTTRQETATRRGVILPPRKAKRQSKTAPAPTVRTVPPRPPRRQLTQTTRLGPARPG